MSKERTITISKSQVFFDMDMLSYGFSEVSGGPEAKRADRLALDTASDNGARIAKRLCDHRISDIRHLLRRLVKSVTSSSASDSFLTGDWTITLYVSDETEDGTLAAVADLIHEYVANGALADYYAQMGAGVNVDSLNNRCNGDLARIRELLYYRPLPSMPS
jgi:hypothetical protein